MRDAFLEVRAGKATGDIEVGGFDRLAEPLKLRVPDFSLQFAQRSRRDFGGEHRGGQRFRRRRWLGIGAGLRFLGRGGERAAERLGLVTEVVDDAALAAPALELAARLATRAPLAVRLSKTMIDAQLAVMITNPSADVREGVAAFFAKRPPKFEGR